MGTRDQFQTNLRAASRTIYRSADKSSSLVVGVIVGAIKSFINTNAPEAASSIAYYSLFSFFPLLIFLVSIVGAILIDEPVQQIVLDAVAEALPTAQEFVKENIERALALQGTVQIVGLIGMLWAASGVFTALTHNLDRAWHTAKERNFLLGRLVALAIIASLLGLLILWVLFITLVNVLPLFEVPLWNGAMIYETYTWSLLSRLGPGLVLFTTFLNLYRWVPNCRVRWLEAAWGAVVATIGWELVTRGFSFYLTIGLARYQLIYGSLGVIVALMLYVYLCSYIVLFGAHLSASIAMKTRLKKAE